MLPIIDYHSHLPAEQLATDHRFRSMTEIWLDRDRDKWRAMRALRDDVRRGLLPDDREHFGELVRNVCFFNARDYFGFTPGQAAAFVEPRA